MSLDPRAHQRPQNLEEFFLAIRRGERAIRDQTNLIDATLAGYRSFDSGPLMTMQDIADIVGIDPRVNPTQFANACLNIQALPAYTTTHEVKDRVRLLRSAGQAMLRVQRGEGREEASGNDPTTSSKEE